MESLLAVLRTPAGVAGGALVAAVASYLVMQLRSRSEERRKIMLDVANKLSSIGFVHLPKILNCLAVGDLSGAFREAKVLFDILHNKDTRIAELKAVGKSILTDLYQDPNYRQEIDDFVNDLRAKNLPDKASAFASAVDQIADQKTLLEDMRAKLASAQQRLSADLKSGATLLSAAPVSAVVPAAVPIMEAAKVVATA